MIERINIDPYKFYDDNSSFLLDFQYTSYANLFKLKSELSGIYRDICIESILKSVFPISDTFGSLSIDYVSHRLSKPKYNEQECLDRGFTYSCSLYVTLRMFYYKMEEASGSVEVSSVKEQEVLLCDIPMMSSNAGSFILNGVQKVIVSQIHRAPGVFFQKDSQKNLSSYNASIIPYRGNWIDFEFDAKGILYCRINRKKKINVAFLLSAFGLDKDKILSTLASSLHFSSENGKILINSNSLSSTLSFDLLSENGNEVLKYITIVGRVKKKE